MATVRRTRALPAPPEAVWEVVADPYHFPRWWPRVQRVEAVEEDGWTQVLETERGRPVRADYRLLASEPPQRRAWELQVAGSPFERFMRESVTEVRVEPAGGGSRVTLELRQRMRGLSRLGGPLARRAARGVLDTALEGLEDACAR